MESFGVLKYVGKKILFLGFFSIQNLISCTSFPFRVQSIESKMSLIKNNISSWNELFAHTDEDYLVYIYSETCFHCLSIKDEIDSFSANCKLPFYYLEFSEDIPIGQDIENTIGATTVEECFIRGTPTLLLIENKAISFNIAGTTNILETIVLYRK